MAVTFKVYIKEGVRTVLTCGRGGQYYCDDRPALSGNVKIYQELRLVQVHHPAMLVADAQSPRKCQ